MARKAKIAYFTSRNAYYFRHNGKQVLLASGPDDQPEGATYLAALDAFKQLMALGNVRTARDKNTVRVVLDTFMDYAAPRLAPGTVNLRLAAFRPFIDRYGEKAIADLTDNDFQDFFEAMATPRTMRGRKVSWGTASVANFILSANSAFNWAIKRKLITVNPLAGIERPAARSRSRECLVSPEDHKRILAECKTPGAYQLATALENCGCRPGELVNATAHDWNDKDGAIVYFADDVRREDEFRHKTAEKKQRMIFFTGEALAMMRKLVAKHPTGPLFRTTRGTKYGQSALCHYFSGIRNKLNMPKLTPYSYRHTLATAWLMRGDKIDILAELLGNTPETIRAHYSHIRGDASGIRKHLEAFKAACGAETSDTPL